MNEQICYIRFHLSIISNNSWQTATQLYCFWLNDCPTNFVTHASLWHLYWWLTWTILISKSFCFQIESDRVILLKDQNVLFCCNTIITNVVTSVHIPTNRFHIAYKHFFFVPVCNCHLFCNIQNNNVVYLFNVQHIYQNRLNSNNNKSWRWSQLS